MIMVIKLLKLNQIKNKKMTLRKLIFNMKEKYIKFLLCLVIIDLEAAVSLHSSTKKTILFIVLKK
jgi:hypothetical protein